MGTNLNKYFAGELTSEEKEDFLLDAPKKIKIKKLEMQIIFGFLIFMHISMKKEEPDL